MSLEPGTRFVRMIEHYSYCVQDEIGSGVSSRVYKGWSERDGSRVAIKVLERGTRECEQMQCEVESLSVLRNQNIIQLLDVYETQRHSYLIMELCDSCVEQQLNKLGYLPEQDVQHIIDGIINAYVEMEQKSILHRDIKPANILLKDRIVKLADFGFSTRTDAIGDKNIGSPLYMSPEALEFSQFSHQSDVWAIGATAFELLYGRPPYIAQTEAQLIVNIKGQLIFPSSPQISTQAQDFITLCLNQVPSHRPHASLLSTHPWIAPTVLFQVPQNQGRPQKKPYADNSKQKSISTQNNNENTL